eukprot:28890-Prymnesium_polylepis.1
MERETRIAAGVCVLVPVAVPLSEPRREGAAHPAGDACARHTEVLDGTHNLSLRATLWERGAARSSHVARVRARLVHIAEQILPDDARRRQGWT